MAANVETMFFVRTAPWHGLGVRVEESLNSEDALRTAGLDWKVNQKKLMTFDFQEISGFKANIREDNKKVLGIVTDRYSVVQNEEAFAFTDALIGNGVTYETAGSLNEGKQVWMLAKLPGEYNLIDEKVDPYLVFSNSHDGSGAIKIAMTPIRVVCQNTLNLALNEVKRTFTAVHVGNMESKMNEARSILLMADKYMNALSKQSEELSLIKLTDKKVMKFIDELIKMPDDASDLQRMNIARLRGDIVHRYFDAPDLMLLPKNSWRFINAISDFANHSEPLRKTARYNENLFAKTMDGNPIIDRALMMIKAA